MRVKLPIYFAVILFYFLIFSRTSLASIELSISQADQSDDEITLNVQLNGSSNPYYIQGLLKHPNHQFYFGQTQNHHQDWVNYASSPEPSFIQNNFYQTDPQSSSWSGQLKVKNNPSDTAYKGSGEYELKLRRYTGNSDSYAGESNVITVNLSYTSPTSTPTPTPTSTPTSTPTLTPTRQSAHQSTPTSTPTPTSSPVDSKSSQLGAQTPLDASGYPTGASPSAQVLGQSITSTPSATPTRQSTSSQNQPSKTPFILILSGGTLILGTTGFWIYRHFFKSYPGVKI